MSKVEIKQETHEAGGHQVDVLQLAGQLDAHTFNTLQTELEGLVTADTPRVVLDFSGLEYISSAGLAVLKKMSREFRAKEGDIRLAALPLKIKNVISLLGFDQVIQVHDDVDKALASFSE